MYRFSGWYEHTIDEKGRTSIPSVFREKLKEHGDISLFVTKSLSGDCLEVWPGTSWNQLLDKVAALPQSKQAVIDFRRMFISAAVEASPDKAGRVMLPGLLRSRVGLVKDVVVTGNIEKMEIWDRAKFAGIHEAADPRVVLEQMGELGI